MALAEVIRVAPGEGNLSKAAKTAKPGDVLELAAGPYRDSVKLGKEVTLRGAGAEKTVLIGLKFAAVTIDGPGVQIEGIEFRPGTDEATRAIDSNTSVWINQCRFVKYPEAVALMDAPLSDVVHCEFVECGVGVRAIGRASPTVWGCVFRGGEFGIVTMRGSPYVYQCLIKDCSIGVLANTPSTAVLRNNVIIRCAKAGIIMDNSDDSNGFEVPTVRNCIIGDCARGIVCESSAVGSVDHNVIFNCKAPPVADSKEKATADPAGKAISTVDPGITIAPDGTVTFSQSNLLTGKGALVWRKTTPQNIGFDPEENRPGCNPMTKAQTPLRRYVGPIHYSNCVNEEYRAVAMFGLGESKQHGTSSGPNGEFLSVHMFERDGKEVTLQFCSERFFGEMMLGH